MESSFRCSHISKIRSIWNIPNPPAYYQRVPHGVVAILNSYSKEASCEDVLQDFNSLIQILSINADRSPLLDSAIFNLFERMMEYEKSANKTELSKTIMNDNFLKNTENNREHGISGYRKFAQKCIEIRLIAKETILSFKPPKLEKELEIGDPLPDINKFTLINLKNLALKGKTLECKRICEEYGFSLGGSIIWDNFRRYSSFYEEKGFLKNWIDLLEVISRFVDASIFKNFFAKECPGCMMISLFGVGYKFEARTVESILRNLFHDKRGTFVELLKHEGLGYKIFENYNRNDNMFGGNCLDIKPGPFRNYMVNLGNCACSQEFIAGMEKNQRIVENFLRNNRKMMEQEDDNNINNIIKSLNKEMFEVFEEEKFEYSENIINNKK